MQVRTTASFKLGSQEVIFSGDVQTALNPRLEEFKDMHQKFEALVATENLQEIVFKTISSEDLQNALNLLINTEMSIMGKIMPLFGFGGISQYWGRRLFAHVDYLYGESYKAETAIVQTGDRTPEAFLAVYNAIGVLATRAAEIFEISEDEQPIKADVYFEQRASKAQKAIRISDGQELQYVVIEENTVFDYDNGPHKELANGILYRNPDDVDGYTSTDEFGFWEDFCLPDQIVSAHEYFSQRETVETNEAETAMSLSSNVPHHVILQEDVVFNFVQGLYKAHQGDVLYINADDEDGYTTESFDSFMSYYG
jgi:hypothetical protein